MQFVIHFFFFNDTATTEIYTLSLHDALPIFCAVVSLKMPPRIFLGGRLYDLLLLGVPLEARLGLEVAVDGLDRKSTRLNSSHANISYAVFCLKKKKN